MFWRWDATLVWGGRWVATGTTPLPLESLAIALWIVAQLQLEAHGCLGGYAVYWGEGMCHFLISCKCTTGNYVIGFRECFSLRRLTVG